MTRQAKMSRSRWTPKECGCVKATLPEAGKVTIRCEQHREKPPKKGRLHCYFDENGMVRRVY